MTKIFEWLENNAIKIILTAVLAWGLFFGILYVQSIGNKITILQNIISQISEYQESNMQVTVKGLLHIIEQLEDVIKTQSYIIDQNRDKVESDNTIKEKITKPTYEEIKSHSVWIEGCSGEADKDDEMSFPIGKESGCWGGTGVIIKTTLTETYILTNNHVSGKGEQDVKLYVENDNTHKLIKAEIIAQHISVDAAVIKINIVLPNKKAIPGIAKAHIQDPVYVVGNPLGVRDVYSEGIVAGYEDTSMLLQMPCIYGNSGSGVFDQNGYLVGLVYALEMYHGFLGIPEARITHSLIVDDISIKMFLKDLGLYE